MESSSQRTLRPLCAKDKDGTRARVWKPCGCADGRARTALLLLTFRSEGWLPVNPKVQQLKLQFCILRQNMSVYKKCANMPCMHMKGGVKFQVQLMTNSLSPAWTPGTQNRHWDAEQIHFSTLLHRVLVLLSSTYYMPFQQTPQSLGHPKMPPPIRTGVTQAYRWHIRTWMPRKWVIFPGTCSCSVAVLRLEHKSAFLPSTSHKPSSSFMLTSPVDTSGKRRSSLVAKGKMSRTQMYHC